MSESFPAGVERRSFPDHGGGQALATRGPPVYGEPTDGEWRLWNPNRSKLGAMFELGMSTGLEGGESVLYLGAASGTTASHVADFAGPTYAIEFSPRPARDLLDVAADRSNLFPLLKDARRPETYAHVVESGLDAIVQDVATRGQAAVALENAQFLRDGGWLLLAVKARSEDVTAEPEAVYDRVKNELSSTFDIETARSLGRYHDDHLAIVARKR